MTDSDLLRTSVILPADMLQRLREIAMRDAAHGGRVNVSAVIVRAVSDLIAKEAEMSNDGQPRQRNKKVG